MRIRHIGVIVLSVLALWLGPMGCAPEPGVEPAPQTEMPPPGTMRLLSVEPVGPAAPANLIENGGFSEWLAGAPAPSGFVAPKATRKKSKLARATDVPDASGPAVRQTWRAGDGEDSFHDVFGVWATGLEPEARYRLTARAHNQSKNDLLLRAVQYNVPQPADAQAGQAEPVPLGQVLVSPAEAFGDYTFDFTTGPKRKFCVLIFVKSRPEGEKFPAVCVWDEWRLVRISSGSAETP